MVKKSTLKTLGVIIVVILFIKLTPVNYTDIVLYIIILGFIVGSLVYNLVEFYKSRKGIYVKGKVLKIEKIDKQAREDYNYVHKVQFTSPVDHKEYVIDYMTFFKSKTKNSDEVNIWVNTKSPAKSIVMEKFGGYWLFIVLQLSFFALIFLGLVVWRFTKI